MAYKSILNYVSISETDITTPTSTQRYPLGLQVTVEDSGAQDATKVFEYVKSHTTLVQYQPYVLNYIATAASEVVTAAPVTQTSPIVQVCVPQVGFTSGYYGFVQVQGQATAKVAAETYASGDPGEVLNAGTTFIVNGTSGVALVDNKTAMIYQATGSAAAAIAVFLVGNKVQNAAA